MGENGRHARHRDQTGRQNIPFDQNDGDGLYYPRAGIHDSLALSGGNWIYTTKHKIVYTFNSNGALVSIADRNSNVISFTRNASDVCTSISDATGRTITLTVDANNKLQSVSDPQGHVWSFTHTAWYGGDELALVDGGDTTALLEAIHTRRVGRFYAIPAIWRRILMIPFQVTIREEEQDRDLSSKLRQELPAILAWAVRGCLAWQRANGFTLFLRPAPSEAAHLHPPST